MNRLRILAAVGCTLSLSLGAAGAARAAVSKEPAPAPASAKAAPSISKTVSLATILGPGDFVVSATGPDWVEIRNMKDRTVVRHRMGANSGLDGGKKIKVTKESVAAAGGTGADLKCGPCRKECALVSTGSSPGPEDDLYSCVCISNGEECKE